jgi:hypothetical protein
MPRLCPPTLTLPPVTQWLLQMGSSVPGIGFQGILTPPAGYPGTMTFVQVVTSVSLTYGNQSCGSSGGLDVAYPFQSLTFSYPPSNAPIYDTPSLRLDSSKYTSESDFNNFLIFLMWEPSYVPNPIPVPIGYVTWGWGGVARYISPNWVLTNGQTSSPMVTQPTIMYPLWKQLNPNPPPGCPNQ